jgi:hypothetical protein
MQLIRNNVSDASNVNSSANKVNKVSSVFNSVYKVSSASNAHKVKSIHSHNVSNADNVDNNANKVNKVSSAVSNVDRVYSANSATTMMTSKVVKGSKADKDVGEELGLNHNHNHSLLDFIRRFLDFLMCFNHFFNSSKVLQQLNYNSHKVFQ